MLFFNVFILPDSIKLFTNASSKYRLKKFKLYTPTDVSSGWLWHIDILAVTHAGDVICDALGEALGARGRPGGARPVGGLEARVDLAADRHEGVGPGRDGERDVFDQRNLVRVVEQHLQPST